MDGDERIVCNHCGYRLILGEGYCFGCDRLNPIPVITTVPDIYQHDPELPVP